MAVTQVQSAPDMILHTVRYPHLARPALPRQLELTMSDTTPINKTDTDPAPELPKGVALTALDPVFRDDPHRILDVLRVAAPVHWDAEFDRVFLTRYEDVRATINDRTLSADPRKGRLGGSRPNFREMEDYEPSMLVLDDPDHKRLRDLVTQAFRICTRNNLVPHVGSGT
jgi:cytochrome P450